MFLEDVSGTYKETGRIKYICNFLILKHEKRCLFRNTQMFQDLDSVHTLVTDSGTNLDKLTSISPLMLP